MSVRVGALLVFTLGFGTPESVSDKESSSYWRWMFLLPAVVAVLQSVLLLTKFKFETPQFSLFVNNDEHAAREVLSKCYITDCTERIYFEEDVPMVVRYIRETNKAGKVL